VHDFGRYWRRTVSPGEPLRPGILNGYLQQLWRLPRPWQVPVQALFVAAGRPGALRRLVGPILRRGASPARVEETYRLGDDLEFADGGSARPHAELGWSRPEATGTWTVGAEARVRLALAAAPRRELLLALTAYGFVCERHPRVAVDVFVNDARVACWEYSNPQDGSVERTARFSASVANRVAPLEIALRIRHPMAPERVGRGVDGRPLGIFVERLRLSEESPA
jgi:hypothetical protein